MNHNDTLLRLRAAARNAMLDPMLVESAKDFIINSGYVDDPQEAMRLVNLLEIYTSKVVAITGAYFTEAATPDDQIDSLASAASEMMTNEMIADIENMLGEL